MTIKEVEQCLGVPRATVRFYEKEGLLSPARGENGYREYSEEDVSLLKKIIIFRKLGFAVTDIEDVLDGAKTMSEALETNVEYLTRQMQELQGALTLCKKMQENREQIETFDAEKYWNAVEEEERKGNHFLDIAKDVVRFEKGLVLEYFGFVDFNGNPKDKRGVLISWAGILFGMVLSLGVLGLLSDPRMSVMSGLLGIVGALVVINIIRIPIYFLAKKHPKVKKHGETIYLSVLLTVAVVSLILTKLLFMSKG